MKTADFDYSLPQDLIAQYPLANRSTSRLLCLESKNAKITHGYFSDLINLITPADLLVFNDTKVIPARLYGKKSTGGQIELLITQILDNTHAQALIRSNKPIKLHTKIFFEQNITAEIIEKNAELITLQFSGLDTIDNILQKIGHIPLPPYINRPDEKKRSRPLSNGLR